MHFYVHFKHSSTALTAHKSLWTRKHILKYKSLHGKVKGYLILHLKVTVVNQTCHFTNIAIQVYRVHLTLQF